MIISKLLAATMVAGATATQPGPPPSKKPSKPAG
jgi:hypothetical protein